MNFKRNHFNKYDSYKLYRIILGILIYVIVAVSIFAVSYEVTLAQQSQPEPRTISPITIENMQVEDLPQLQPTEHEYVLKDSNGKVAVYKIGEYEPYMILEVYTSTLPYVDRMSLLEGITVIGDENLRQIIEDFDS